MRVDNNFTGSIAALYEEYLVPLIFQPYAGDLANRLQSRKLHRVLEIACGTGVVTRALASTLPSSVDIIATDLNPAMINEASAVGTSRNVTWQVADAMKLPFEDNSFDAIICQFGVMFFPDKVAAFKEARRVLKRDGVFLFNVWDRIEDNEFADVVTNALVAELPHDPPRFLARTPHGYHDRAGIERDLVSAGFNTTEIETVTKRSCASSPAAPAIAYCQGTPLRSELERAAPNELARLTDLATEAVAQRFGRGDVDGRIQAHVVTASTERH
jgi:SAM-dependent methyltransferase